MCQGKQETRLESVPAQEGAPATGAEILVRSLQAEGVGHVFTVPDAMISSLLAAFAGAAPALTEFTQEFSAVLAAAAASRSGCRCGVALLSAGACAAAAVPGMATAQADSVPLVVLTVQVDSASLGTDAFREVDTVGVMRPVCKHNYLVSRVEDLAQTVRNAFFLATTGRPGPVHVDICCDVLAKSAPFAYPADPQIRSYSPVVKGHSGQEKKAVRLVAESSHPVMLVGGGVVMAGAQAEISRLAKVLDIPVVCTMMGLGGFDAADLHYVGMSGSRACAASQALLESDCVLALGTRFDIHTMRSGNFPNKEQRRIIQVDIDPVSVSRTVSVDVPIVGDVREVARDLAAIASGPGGLAGRVPLTPWWERIAQLRSSAEALDSGGRGLTGAEAVRILFEALPAGAAVTADAELLAELPGRAPAGKSFGWVLPGGLGTAGSVIPAAAGIRAVAPGRVIAGAATAQSLMRSVQELSVLAPEGAATVICAFHRTPPAVRIGDMARLAGLRSARASDRRTLRTALAAALAENRATVIDITLEDQA